MTDPLSSKPGHPPASPAARRQRRRLWLLVAAVIVVLAFGTWRIVRSAAGGTAAAAAPVAVTVAPVQRATFVVHASAPGVVTPINTALVRSEVSGRLTSVVFKEGQAVKRGELLATLDPRPFQADVDVASGKLASDSALLANARDTLTRYQALLAQHSIEPQRVADQQALVRQYAAAVQVDQGHLASAQLQLANARIVAPISGIAGLRNVDPGNLVGPSDPHGIVRITQLAPTTVVFALPGAVLAGAARALKTGAAVTVTLPGADTTAALQGHLLAMNNQIDPATGTIMLKAEFANTADTLFPNQPVTVELPVQTLPAALTVPVAAVQHGADGAFVYVVDGHGKAVLTPVTTGPADATTAVISTGVAAGMRVVVAGADRLRNGVAVAPTGADGGAR